MVGYRRLPLLPLLALSLLAACQKELTYYDYGEVKEVKLSYTTPATQSYFQDIDSLRWLLFDADGRYLRDLQMTNRQRQYFDRSDLPDGDYTVVCVANATARSIIDNSRLTLDNLLLRANTRQDEGWYSNIDQLYWQMARFTLSPGAGAVELPLADIHCHLHVRLWWQSVPDTDGDYTLRLYEVPVACRGGRTGQVLGGVPHPELAEEYGEHRIEVEPYNFIISGEFITMRWTDDHMPLLQLWCGNQAVSPLIDLYDVFSEWHWSPDRTVAQDYWLNIEVLTDGSVNVSVGGNSRITDWQNGGTIGGTV